MPKTFIQQRLDIDVRPEIEIRDSTSDLTDLSLGDLHANAVKLLYFLVRHGICQISAEHYTRLVAIYKMPVSSLTEKEIAEFNRLVASMQITNRSLLVRLIGDELSDRGSNDYFVLKILQKLHQENVNVEVLISNHGVEFVEAYERFKERDNQFEITTLVSHAPSLTRMSYLVEKGLVKADEVLEIANQCYKPHLKLISYSLDEKTQGITIYSHAGIGLESIQALAQKFHIAYKDETSKQLALTIDKINQKFNQIYVRNNCVHTLYSQAELKDGYYQRMFYKGSNVIEYIMWNRECTFLHRPEYYNNYPVSFVHGHDSKDFTGGNIFNLDGDSGKTLYLHQDGEYIVLASDESQLLQALSEKTSEVARCVFMEALDILAEKIADLSKRKETGAHHAASELYTKLADAGALYFESAPTEQSYQQFKVTCDDGFQEARPELEKHRGWKQILGNLAFLILGLGVGYIVAVGINKVATGHFLFFSKTTSAEKLDLIEEAIRRIDPDVFLG